MTQRGRLCLYYRTEPERSRWVPGDQYVRPWVRRLLRGKPRMGGVAKVFANLCLGLDRLGLAYEVNLPFPELRATDRVGVLGRGRYALAGYDRRNPVVAGIGLMTHPSEWPTLCSDYPVRTYLQHSEWTCNLYRPYFGERCAVWPAGIDTRAWNPDGRPKDLDFLVYDKVQWDRDRRDADLIQPVLRALGRRGLTHAVLRYGAYDEPAYRELLARSRAMIFLTEHESQGLACQECLSCDVPVLAWNQGHYLDPNRFGWGLTDAPATSVPYFDARCGEVFRAADEFEDRLDLFLDKVGRQAYGPRSFVLEHLTLEASATAFVRFLDAAMEVG